MKEEEVNRIMDRIMEGESLCVIREALLTRSTTSL